MERDLRNVFSNSEVKRLRIRTLVLFYIEFCARSRINREKKHTFVNGQTVVLSSSAPNIRVLNYFKGYSSFTMSYSSNKENQHSHIQYTATKRKIE